jgi:hypothetical protein
LKSVNYKFNKKIYFVELPDGNLLLELKEICEIYYLDKMRVFNSEGYSINFNKGEIIYINKFICKKILFLSYIENFTTNDYTIDFKNINDEIILFILNSNKILIKSDVSNATYNDIFNPSELLFYFIKKNKHRYKRGKFNFSSVDEKLLSIGVLSKDAIYRGEHTVNNIFDIIRGEKISFDKIYIYISYIYVNLYKILLQNYVSNEDNWRIKPTLFNPNDDDKRFNFNGSYFNELITQLNLRPDVFKKKYLKYKEKYLILQKLLKNKM